MARIVALSSIDEMLVCVPVRVCVYVCVRSLAVGQESGRGFTGSSSAE
jgi:hypothetical protein